MTALVIKNLPEGIHTRLVEQAQRNHRSLTKEAVSLIEAGLQPAPPEPPRPAAWREAQPALPAGPGTAGDANPRRSAPAASPAIDGRAALRAALVEQPDGSYVNVLGIDDGAFFETLDRIRAETRWPSVEGLFDEATF